MGKDEMYKIGELITFILKNRENKTACKDAAAKVQALANEFPVYTNI